MSQTVGYGWAKPGVFQIGRGKTLAIPMDVHASSRAKLVDIMSKAPYNASKGIVLLKGGEEQSVYDTDGEPLFRQDSWFNYLFGVKEPGVYGAIELSTGATTLFIPKLPQEYRIWCGEIHPPSIFASSYAISNVEYTDVLIDWLIQHLQSEGDDGKIFLLHGRNSDSGLYPKQIDWLSGMDRFSEIAARVDSSDSVFFHALSTARVTKSAAEIQVMRYCAWVASQAHVAVMRAAQPGMIEYELEARFQYEIYRSGGCRKCAYTSICACGPNGATLHYGHAGAPNDRPLQDGDMGLLDMGAEYHGYVSDITCSFPISSAANGSKFTSDQAAIYQGVLNAQKAVMQMIRPGITWPDCHRAAEAEIITALQSLGILSPDASIQALADAGLGAVFFPHGLGHLIGCDTHDVGGYISGTPERVPGPGLTKLRTARILEAGMVLTNEPGCYFIDALLDAALSDASKSGLMDAAVLSRFRGFGGVRLEDVVMVTETGAENLTTCPRTIQEVDSVLSGGAWPPAVDDAPYLYRRWTRLAPGGHCMEVFELPAAK